MAILQEAVDKFRVLAPMLLPELMMDSKFGEVDYMDESCVVQITLAREFDIEDVMDMFEDQMELTILYNYMPSVHTSFGHQCCAYSDSKFGHMYKIHVTTNPSGLVDSLVATVYDSLEVMCSDLLDDLDRHEKQRGRFLDRRERADILVEFC